MNRHERFYNIKILSMWLTVIITLSLDFIIIWSIPFK